MEYEFKHGRKTVERFLDAVLAIEEHIDPYFFIKREVSIAESAVPSSVLKKGHTTTFGSWIRPDIRKWKRQRVTVATMLSRVNDS